MWQGHMETIPQAFSRAMCIDVRHGEGAAGQGRGDTDARKAEASS